MADIPTGTHALACMLRYSGPDIDIGQFSGVVRSALRDSAGRLARDGYVALRCEAHPAPFVQTWRKSHDIVAHEWAMVVMALVEVREHPVAETALRDVFLRAAQSFGASIDASGVRIERAPVADLARAAEAAPFAPKTYPAPYEPWRYTPAAGQAGYVPLPGCAASPSVRLPRQAGGAAPAPTAPPRTTPPASPGPGATPAPTEGSPYYPPPVAPPGPPTSAPADGPPAERVNWRILKAGAAAVAVFVVAAVAVNELTD